MSLANLHTLNALKGARLGKDAEFEAKHARDDHGKFAESSGKAVSVASVNAALARKFGKGAVTLRRGNGYYYFTGEPVEGAHTQGVYVARVGQLSMEQWLKEADSRVEETKGAEGRREHSGPLRIGTASANASPSGIEYTDWGNLNSDLKTIERNERKPMDGAFDRCAFCSNPITDNKGDKQAWVASTKNSQIIPADVDPNGKHHKDMQFHGYYPVGPECAKKVEISHYVRRMPASGMEKNTDELVTSYQVKNATKESS